MASVLSTPFHKANLSKHGHDVSQSKKFTSSVGQLLPVYYDRLYPGDKIVIKNELISRTMDLETAAMTDITEHIDYFFVPMTQIYSLFDSWIYGVQDVRTSLVDVASISHQFPHIRYDAIQQFFDSLGYQGQDVGYGNGSIAHDQFGVVECDNISRLWQLFGFGNHAYEYFSWLQDSEGSSSSISGQQPPNFGMGSYDLSLPAVYQKIYMDFYRLSDREANDPLYYSLDRFYETPLVTDPTAIRRLFTMRYRPLKKDLYTSAQVSPIVADGDIGILDNNSLLNVNQWLAIVDPYFDGRFSETLTIGDGEGAQNVAGINTIFAVNKLLEITRRAGKHYDAQTLAHFGQEVPNGIAGEVMYLGSHTSKISIGDVLATASNSDDNTYLGQVGGKGYGYGSSSPISIKAPCHGIIMGIYSAVPEIDYMPTGIDRLNTYINSYDHWTPEFDKLGMQPLFAYQSNTKIVDTSAASPRVRERTSDELNEVLGWSYRYEELKTKIDLVLGGFSTSLDYWSTSKEGQQNNALNNYLCDPSYLNKIMLLNYKPEATSNYMPSSAFDRDPLIHMLRVDAKKVSAMCTYGLDSL